MRNNEPEKEFKIEATLYLPVYGDETEEELIDRISMLIDPDVCVQLYEETAEIRDL